MAKQSWAMTSLISSHIEVSERRISQLPVSHKLLTTTINQHSPPHSCHIWFHNAKMVAKKQILRFCGEHHGNCIHLLLSTVIPHRHSFQNTQL